MDQSAQTKPTPKQEFKSNSVPSMVSRGLLARLYSSLRGGMSFLGQRDVYQVFGYPRILGVDDLLAKYERQDIAARIVDTPAEEMWAYPPVVKGESGFDTQWKAFTDAHGHRLWPAVTQADKLCSFDVFSALYLGLPGNPALPAPKVSKPEDLRYIMAHGAGSIEIDSYNRDQTNPRFGLPEYYSLQIAESEMTVKVHHSRIVHIVDRPLQGRVTSNPRLANIYNLLDDLLKVGGGSAETYWLTGNRGMQIDVDKDMQLTTDDADDLQAEIDEYQHQLRRVLRTRGVKVNTLGAEIADPTGPFKVTLALLAAATGIPQRILMGAEAGQLASEQDRANWAEYVERRRKNFAEPYMFMPLFESLANIGLLPVTKTPPIFEWPSAFHQSPLEKAQTQAQFARSVVNLSRQAMEGFPLATLEECRVVLGLPSDVPAGQKLPEPLPEPEPKPFGNPGAGAGAGKAS